MSAKSSILSVIAWELAPYLGNASWNAAKHGAAHQAKLNKVGALFGRIF